MRAWCVERCDSVRRGRLREKQASDLGTCDAIRGGGSIADATWREADRKVLIFGHSGSVRRIPPEARRAQYGGEGGGAPGAPGVGSRAHSASRSVRLTAGDGQVSSDVIAGALLAAFRPLRLFGYRSVFRVGKADIIGDWVGVRPPSA